MSYQDYRLYEVPFHIGDNPFLCGVRRNPWEDRDPFSKEEVFSAVDFIGEVRESVGEYSPLVRPFVSLTLEQIINLDWMSVEDCCEEIFASTAYTPETIYDPDKHELFVFYT